MVLEKTWQKIALLLVLVIGLLFIAGSLFSYVDQTSFNSPTKSGCEAKESEFASSMIDSGFSSTCNTCVIETKKTGTLARGGSASVPKGISSIPVGGFNFDKGIADALYGRNAISSLDMRSRAFLSNEIRFAKERISLAFAEGSTCTARLDAVGTLPPKELNYQLLCDVFEAVLWHPIRITIENTLDEFKSSMGAASSVDYVIMTGGTSQFPFLQLKIMEDKKLNLKEI